MNHLLVLGLVIALTDAQEFNNFIDPVLDFASKDICQSHSLLCDHYRAHPDECLPILKPVMRFICGVNFVPCGNQGPEAPCHQSLETPCQRSFEAPFQRPYPGPPFPKPFEAPFQRPFEARPFETPFQETYETPFQRTYEAPHRTPFQDLQPEETPFREIEAKLVPYREPEPLVRPFWDREVDFLPHQSEEEQPGPFLDSGIPPYWDSDAQESPHDDECCPEQEPYSYF